MKYRAAPKKPNFDRSLHRHPAFKHQFKRWAERLTADPETIPEDLPRELYDFVASQLVLQRGGRSAQTHFERAKEQMTPVLSVPECDDPLGDLHLIFALPEMQDFWRDWTPQLGSGPAGKRRGPKPAWDSAKATLAVLGMTGVTSHVRDAYSVLGGASPNTRLLEMFESLSRLADDRANPSLPGIGAAPVPLKMASEKTVARLINQMAEHTIAVASRARMRLVLSLKDYYPKADFRVLMDGTDAPAWTKQVGASGGAGSEGDMRLRARAPEAGYRLYKRAKDAPGGKTDVSGRDAARPLIQAKIVKSWRGYYAVALMFQQINAWGPITVFDASVDEASAIVPLLSTAYQQAADLKAAGLTNHDLEIGELVADSAWDEDRWCELCLVQYGIDPIFRLHNAKPRTLDPGESRDGSIKGIGAQGELVCSAHGSSLDHGALERPSRKGMQPGQPTDPRKFRLRAGENKCGCGRLSLQSQSDWSKLVKHPHHPEGRPDLYGHRRAALQTLNQIESGFNSLKTGRKVCNGGEERTRLLEKNAVHALIELAALSQVAAIVVQERAKRNTHLSLAVPPSGTVQPGDGTANDLREAA